MQFTMENRESSDGGQNIPPPTAWAIFLQYPILSYLDSRRKLNLFNIIAQLVQQGDMRVADFNESDFCVGRVFHHKVAEYEES